MVNTVDFNHSFFILSFPSATVIHTASIYQPKVVCVCVCVCKCVCVCVCVCVCMCVFCVEVLWVVLVNHKQLII